MEKIIDASGPLDTTETELVKFITPSGERLRVLVVESPACLVELRRILPAAEIVVVTNFCRRRSALPGWICSGCRWTM